MQKETRNIKQPVYVWIIWGLILFFRLFYYSNVEWGKWLTDSADLVNYDPHYDICMFGYPMLIRLVRVVTGDAFCVGVAAVQAVVSTVSVWFMYRCLMMMTKENKLLSLIITCFYACSPSILQWDMLIMTESLTISLTVFFIYFALKWLREYKKSDAVGFVLMAFLATIVKTAAFVYVGAIFILILLIILFKKEKRKAAVFLLGLNILLGLFDLGYAAYNYTQCGLFAMSSLSSRHKLVHALRSGTYLNYPDKELVEKIDTIYRENDYIYGYVTTTPVIELFGDTWQEQNKGTLAYAKACLRSDLPAYAKDLLVTALEEVRWKFRAGYATRLDRPAFVGKILDIMEFIFDPLRVAYVCLVCLIGFVLFIIDWIRKKECPFEMMGLVGGILLVLVSVNVAAYSEWTRLLVYSLPFFYVLVGNLISRILSCNYSEPCA